jgi:hypothetical protein
VLARQALTASTDTLQIVNQILELLTQDTNLSPQSTSKFDASLKPRGLGLKQAAPRRESAPTPLV